MTLWLLVGFDFLGTDFGGKEGEKNDSIALL